MTMTKESLYITKITATKKKLINNNDNNKTICPTRK